VSLMVASGRDWPEMAVPMTVKIPEPMTAPMPSAVNDHGPSVFLSACSGSHESLISLSMDLRASSWLGRAVHLIRQVAEHCQSPAWPASGSIPIEYVFAAVYRMRLRHETGNQGSNRKRGDGPLRE